MIRGVTFYQVRCDLCGVVHGDTGYAAWSDPSGALEAAADWWEFRVDVPDGARTDRQVPAHDGAPSHSRTVHVCDQHTGEGISWCSTCEADLDDGKWQPTVVDAERRPGFDEALVQTCPEGHTNTLRLLPVEDPEDGPGLDLDDLRRRALAGHEIDPATALALIARLGEAISELRTSEAILEAESTHADGDDCAVCDHIAAHDALATYEENARLTEQIERLRALHQPIPAGHPREGQCAGCADPDADTDFCCGDHESPCATARALGQEP